MPFDWREYLELARYLAALSNTRHSEEASRRSAVSRAYYSAFCYMRNFAERNLGFHRTRIADDHRQLRILLKKHNVKLASYLNTLRIWRNKCDYDVEVNDLDHFIQNAIAYANEIIQACR